MSNKEWTKLTWSTYGSMQKWTKLTWSTYGNMQEWTKLTWSALEYSQNLKKGTRLTWSMRKNDFCDDLKVSHDWT